MLEYIWDFLTVGSNYFSYKTGQRFKALGILSILLIMLGVGLIGLLKTSELLSFLGVITLTTGIVLLLVSLVVWINSTATKTERSLK